MQSAITKLDDKVGRAAIISNGSPLFTGGVSSGESQTRRWLLENDLIEAIIAMPTDLFYNTGIATYAWIISKNKRPERRGKIQLIDATNIYHKLRKPMGNKKNEFKDEDREAITKLYSEFKNTELCQIHYNNEFIYREYTVMQPLQRSYGITAERIENMLQNGSLDTLYSESTINKIESKAPSEITAKDAKKVKDMKDNYPVYSRIIERLHEAESNDVYLSPMDFDPIIYKVLGDIVDKKLISKIADGLSSMDKDAEVQKDRKGNIIYDTSTKDTETVNIDEDINVYMEREVLPHIPDAKAFFEEDVSKKKPVIKTGAEIPFTRYFYKYQQPIPSEALEKQFVELEESVSARIAKLFK